MYFQEMLGVSRESNPLITVITVVFNGEKTIESTIKSVINFRNVYRNVEYIIVDGNSNDKTKEIAFKYEKEINFWISEVDKGIYDAMNKGWEIARESYILYLGSGDTILSFPKSLPDLTSNKVIYYGKVFIGNDEFTSDVNYKIKIGNTLHHQALLIHKSACKVNPFNIGLKVYADYDLNARLFKEKYNFVYLNEFESYALPGGLSSNIYIKELLDVVRSNFGIAWMFLACIYYLTQGFKHGFFRYRFK
jgi:glycosyltransferase involved in cell wall biosynthesis